MKNELIIIGAGGHGKVIADIAIKTQKWNNIYFLDDDVGVRCPLGLEVVGKSADAYQYARDYFVFVGIGNGVTREKIQTNLESQGANIPVLVHPSAILGSHVELGCGTAVMAGAVINCSTKVGKGCIINTGATIDHDNLIHDYVHVSPGAHLAGTVTVGRGSWIGVGSSITNNIFITSGCSIGAGAVVVNNLYECGTYVGVPAHKIK